MKNIQVINQSVAVVTELPQRPVLNEFRTITQALVCAQFSGKVVFDLLVSKGVNGRFIEIKFDGCHLDRSSLRILSNSEVPNSVVTAQNSFFKKHKSMLRNSVLSSKEISRLF
ncbi:MULTISPECIES: type II toxin-antitoxin system RnlB family antitoxin [Vibrio]|uniref:type II toxin-antitoxin system RnlB family antitoxin n=1 Tax=Vibrio TaxID=662 RepID=UPI000721B921|nr:MULTISPECIES: type II toxin-antitoxin system RnlB family antitoxin [Vibrio]ALR91664.1 hypothetical protein AT730_04365 [Vibrio alginolyticus]EJU9539420.1 type II toxin-antitoxin system RnlB family antitoxin [Vibrio alginolyticus]ELA8350188.1 type II toxin-antitoxin system RnlB family antitoxin [Vibrio alginolyticus]ELA8466704.1 type II toxin-antitoxin system RnlB family antitoxin [Vibrio alginolyticus]MBO0199660.1 type II toxin-antitoxin system RnlB family antitoxin [Vibrio alginolyticus]